MINLKDYQILFIDFETFYSTEEKYDLKSISMTEYIRDSRFKAHGVGYIMQSGKPHWISGDHALTAFFHLVDWPNVIVVAHNVKFDGAILAWKYGGKPAYYLDTQTMAKAVLGNNASSYSLRALAEYYGMEPKGELKANGKRDLTKAEERDLGEYCKHDTELCAELFKRLMKEFPAGQLRMMDWTARAFIEPTLELNVPVLERMVVDEKVRRETVIAKCGVSKEELSSNAKFAEVLRSRGILVPTKKSARTGKDIPAFALGDADFVALQDQDGELYNARVAAKSSIVETRGTKLIHVGKSGAFPFDVQFSGAVQTHRFSGGAGAGGNPQNFPRKGPMREAVCPPDNHSLVVGDFAAIELRIISWLAKEPKLMNSLIHGTDIYGQFASEQIYHRPINKHDSPVERQIGKAAVLGLGYGMGADKFQKKVKIDTGEDISDAQASGIVDAYREHYFNIPKLWKQAEKCIPLIANGRLSCLPFAPFIRVEKNVLVLPSGLKVRYPNLRRRTMQTAWGQKEEWVYDVYKRRYVAEPVTLYGGKLIENICQALAGEICKLAIERCLDSKMTIAGQIHDELIGVAQIGYRDERAMMQRFMEAPVPFWPELRLKAEVGYGSNWQAAKAA